MPTPGQPPAAARQPAWRMGERCIQLLPAALGLGLAACHLVPSETPQAKAKPGDVLVRSGSLTVTLVKPFRQGEPNGLFDGVIRVQKGANTKPELIEVNAICSLPGEPGWPGYDNLYGRSIASAEEAKGRSGDTQWQILFNFSGPQDVRMGQKPGPWADRLRDNLCRRGSFDDRPHRGANRTETDKISSSIRHYISETLA